MPTPVAEAPPGTVRVPLRAAFAGWRGLPWLAWARSDVLARLVLHPAEVETRVLRTRRRTYATVAEVDHRRGPGTENVILTFRGSVVTFAGNAVDAAVAAAAIRVLRDRGCPLSDRARALLEPAP